MNEELFDELHFTPEEKAARKLNRLHEGIRYRLIDLENNARALRRSTEKLLDHRLIELELEAIQDALTAMLFALQVTSTEIATCANHR